MKQYRCTNESGDEFIKLLEEEWPGGYDYYDPGEGLEKTFEVSPDLFPDFTIYRIIINATGYEDVVITIEGPMAG